MTKKTYTAHGTVTIELLQESDDNRNHKGMNNLTREDAIKRIRDIANGINVHHLNPFRQQTGDVEIGAMRELMAIFDIKEEEIECAVNSMNIYHLQAENKGCYIFNAVVAARNKKEAIDLTGWNEDFYIEITIKSIGTAKLEKPKAYAVESW